MKLSRLVFILATLFSGSAFAEEAVLIHAAAFYGDFLSQYGSDASTKDSTTVVQADIGYVWANNFHLGLRHYNETMKSEVIIEQAGTTSITAKDNSVRTGTGIVLGYHASIGLTLDVSYLFFKVKNRSGTNSLLGGHALNYDLAYRVKIGNSFAVGPQISLTTFSYKKEKTDGVTSDLEGTWREQHVLPYVAFWIYM